MTNEPLTVSVVICAYTEQRWHILERAVSSVLGQTLTPRELILVIDHNPALFDRAQLAFTACQVIENDHAPGVTGARNAGILQAAGEIVAFIDDDAVASPDWLARLLAGYTSPRIAGVGGWVEPLWEDKPPNWLPEEFYWVIGCSYRGLPDKPAPVRNFIGCNMSFRRDALLSVGGFTEAIGHVQGRPSGDDETDFCIRLHQSDPNCVLLLLPGAIVRHYVPGARGTWRYLVYRCYLEGQSKAGLARAVGANDALTSERRYTLSVLPRGVLTHLGHGFKGDLSGIARAAAILVGLSVTVLGFLRGRLRRRRG